MKLRPRANPVPVSILAIAVLLASSVALAQPMKDRASWHGASHHGPPGATHHLARLDEALDLSDEQAAELLELLQATDAERRTLHERIVSEHRPEFCVLMQETEAGILAVLTPEQAETFEQLKAERRERFAGRWGDGVPALDCENPDG